MMIVPPTTRACQRCGRRYPHDRHHFTVYPPRKDGTVTLRKVCRACKTTADIARDFELRNDPERQADYHARRAEAARKWRHKHRDRMAQSQRRWRGKVYADPERHAALLDSARRWRDANRERVNEEKRLRERLKAEREGRTMRALPVMHSDGTRAPVDYPATRLDATVLVEPIRRRLHTESFDELGRRIGIHPDVLRRIASGAHRYIAFEDGDRFCVALGFNLFDFWPDA